MYAASQAILGIKPDYDGLMIDPHLPKEIKHAKVRRVFRGITYDITINNTGKNKYSMVVNGTPVEGKVIPFNKNDNQFIVVIDL